MNFSYSQPCCVCPDSSSLTTSLSSSKGSHRNRFESPGLGLVTSHTYLNMSTTYTIVSSWNPPKSEVSPGNTRYFTLLLGLTLDSHSGGLITVTESRPGVLIPETRFVTHSDRIVDWLVTGSSLDVTWNGDEDWDDVVKSVTLNRVVMI